MQICSGLPTATVIVPTFKRPDDLARCLRALSSQTIEPQRIVIVMRGEDADSAKVISAHLLVLPMLITVEVNVPGQVAALNAGLEAAIGDIVAITDDDAAPHPSWLYRLLRHFADDPRVGGVGGRDWVHENGEVLSGNAMPVGRVLWHGRPVGNHHLGYGGPRDVEILKGANMSYRRSAVAGLFFDGRLLGRGAQVCNDLAFSTSVRRRGWRLIYDPEVAVNHFPAPRADEDLRNTFNPLTLAEATHNETLALLDYLPVVRRTVFMLWALAVGTRLAPGLLAAIQLQMIRRDRTALARSTATRRGRIAGFSTWWESRRQVKE